MQDAKIIMRNNASLPRADNKPWLEPGHYDAWLTGVAVLAALCGLLPRALRDSRWKPRMQPRSLPMRQGSKARTCCAMATQTDPQAISEVPGGLDSALEAAETRARTAEDLLQEVRRLLQTTTEQLIMAEGRAAGAEAATAAALRRQQELAASLAESIVRGDVLEIRVRQLMAALAAEARAEGAGAAATQLEPRARAAEEAQRQAERRLRSLIELIRHLCRCPITQEVLREPVLASDGYTYEHEAITQWVQQCMQRGEPPTSPVTRAFLSYCVFANRFAREVVQHLLETEEELDAADEVEEESLLSLLEEQNAAAALLLLQKAEPPADLSMVSSSGHTALVLAMDLHATDVAMKILSRPEFAAVNVRTIGGWTALHWAAGQGNLQICEAILSRSDFCEHLAVNNNGNLASEVARRRGHSRLAELLSSAEASVTAGQPST